MFLLAENLVSALTENQIFVVDSYPSTEQELSRQVETGKLTAGIVIPPEFRRDISQGKTAEIQAFIDGVDANTAGIANGYINQIMQQYSLNLSGTPPSPLVKPEVIFLYNPGLISSWFFVPGVMGFVLTLIGSLVSAVTVVREKDTGTLEQLLMTPAEAWEILLAKVVPLFVLLMGDVFLALSLGRVVFGLPFRGNLLLFVVMSGLYFICWHWRWHYPGNDL